MVQVRMAFATLSPTAADEMWGTAARLVALLTPAHPVCDVALDGLVVTIVVEADDGPEAVTPTIARALADDALSGWHLINQEPMSG